MTQPPIRPSVRFFAVASMAVLLSVLFLTANLYFLLSPAYVARQYTSLYERDQAALKSENAVPIINYLNKKTDEPPPELTTRERLHLADVRQLFELAAYISIVSALVLTFTFRTVKRLTGSREFPRLLGLAAATGSASLGFFLLAAAVNFDWIFDRFHLVFFAGDSWLFSADSTLIRLFPLEFWFGAAWDWALLTLLELAVLGAASLIVYRLRLAK
jgi:integral membrane protein (TIGR01906 family)